MQKKKSLHESQPSDDRILTQATTSLAFKFLKGHCHLLIIQ